MGFVQNYSNITRRGYPDIKATCSGEYPHFLSEVNSTTHVRLAREPPEGAQHNLLNSIGPSTATSDSRYAILEY